MNTTFIFYVNTVQQDNILHVVSVAVTLQREGRVKALRSAVVLEASNSQICSCNRGKEMGLE